MPVLLIGTFDTKGPEFGFVREQLLAGGLEILAIDAGVQGEPGLKPDLTREELFRAAGTSLADVKRAGDRGQAVTTAARGAARLASKLMVEGKVEGVLSLGGSAGTTIGTAAMQALPLGIPKVMVSTLASGQVRPFVGVRDIFMLHAVVDISGVNRISRLVLTNAAQAMIGMVHARRKGLGQAPTESADRPLVTATMFGVTTPCVEAARKQLEGQGNEVLVFHATGVGGQTMEGLIADGLVAGVLDITTTELADELVGGVLSAGPDRLTAAARRGTPQVISVGALDMVNFGPRDTVPAKYAERRFHQHNANVTLMRTTPEENDLLGKEIALKASAAQGPTAILLPLRGVSAIDAEGQPFWWPDADRALFESIRLWRSPNVELVELDLHINDPAFAAAAAEKLQTMMAKKKA
ncbi:MAG TPA: Tm-1-like ATP-binding domain-containing protein [Gemmatales bacterium]|nr:Tm-1-like ATP-binding domain-containing protein [Gemmatales bacterium]HMP60625.1 Tm-1-like ATP-binding domain-containing protein [Gemmatales bacterium]